MHGIRERIEVEMDVVFVDQSGRERYSEKGHTVVASLPDHARHARHATNPESPASY